MPEGRAANEGSAECCYNPDGSQASLSGYSTDLLSPKHLWFQTQQFQDVAELELS